MERAGWIERRNGEARCVNAHLTAAGRQKLVASAPGHVREVRRLVIDVLTAEQLAVLGEAARLVAAQADPVMAAALTRRFPSWQRPSLGCGGGVEGDVVAESL
jgi:DNA-binding FadR family transcriptional regulator